MKKSSFGYLELTLAQMCVGTNLVLGKHLTTIFPIFLFLAIRFTMVPIMLLMLAHFNKIPLAKLQDYSKKFSRKEWGPLLLQALVGNFAFNLLSLSGMRLTTACATGIITSFTPALIVILSSIILKEKLTKLKVASIALGLFGLIVIALGTNTDQHAVNSLLLGDLLILISVFPEAIFTILVKKTSNRIPPVASAFWIGVFTLVMYIPFAVAQSQHFSFSAVTSGTWLLLFFSACMSVAFYTLWAKGLKSVPANIAALFVALMPVTTILIASIFLGERLNLLDDFGLLFVMGSIVMGTGAWKYLSSRRRKERRLAINENSE